MRTFTNPARVSYMTFMLVVLTFTTLRSQVITRILSSEDYFGNYIPWYPLDYRIPTFKTTEVNVDSVLENDRRFGRNIPRIAVKEKIQILTEDGTLHVYDKFIIWTLSIYSENAKSMGIKFTHTVLPESALMFLYNEDHRFIMGPIRNNNFKNGVFRSDFVNGDKITIEVYMPRELDEQFKINVSDYYHGIIQFKEFDDDFGTSGGCNNNLACENNWDCQGDAVCKVISLTGSCTGALINSTCCDLTPYILTADHCVVPNDLVDYVFRFKYESPECNPTTEPLPGEWVSYTGAILRANWDFQNGTDFALLELQDALDPNASHTFAGWERTTVGSNNSTCIHHPLGDVKKISFDDDASTVNGLWHRVVWDDGTTELGSSGSPLYNHNQHLIGQLRGGGASCEDPELWDEFGRFDQSWTGGGTNGTRLSNWLGVVSSPNNLDCMDYPTVDGEDAVECDESSEYTIVSNMPCTPDNISWRVLPTALFESPTSGTGSTAVITAKEGLQGSGTLIFEISTQGCTDANIEYDILWVGKPAFSVNSEASVCPGDPYTAFVVAEGPVDLQTLQWSSTGVVELGNKISPYAIEFKATSGGSGTICAALTNSCGTTQWCNLIFADDQFCRGSQLLGEEINVDSESIRVYPNPIFDYVNIEIDELESSEIYHIPILFYDVHQRLVYSEYLGRSSSKISLASFPHGLYIVQIILGNQIVSHKIIKK